MYKVIHNETVQTHFRFLKNVFSHYLFFCMFIHCMQERFLGYNFVFYSIIITKWTKQTLFLYNVGPFWTILSQFFAPGISNSFYSAGGTKRPLLVDVHPGCSKHFISWIRGRNGFSFYHRKQKLGLMMYRASCN